MHIQVVLKQHSSWVDAEEIDLCDKLLPKDEWSLNILSRAMLEMIVTRARHVMEIRGCRRMLRKIIPVARFGAGRMKIGGRGELMRTRRMIATCLLSWRVSKTRLQAPCYAYLGRDISLGWIWFVLSYAEVERTNVPKFLHGCCWSCKGRYLTTPPASSGSKCKIQWHIFFSRYHQASLLPFSSYWVPLNIHMRLQVHS